MKIQASGDNLRRLLLASSIKKKRYTSVTVKKKQKYTIKKMNIYIDGSCRPSSRFGSYGILIIDDNGNRKTLTGTRDDVTNNIMEMMALLEALKYIHENKLDEQYEVDIYCDSQYVVKGVKEWWPKWVANNYRTTTGPVKNLELWKEIMDWCVKVKCTLNWVKGHAENARHNEIDQIVYDLSAKK